MRPSKTMLPAWAATLLLLVPGLAARAEERLIYNSKKSGRQVYHVLDDFHPLRISIKGPTTLTSVLRVHVYPGKTSLGKPIKVVVQEGDRTVESFTLKLRKGKKRYAGIREFVPTRGKRFKLKVPAGEHAYTFRLDPGESRTAAVHFKHEVRVLPATGEVGSKLSEPGVSPGAPEVGLPPLVPPPSSGPAETEVLEARLVEAEVPAAPAGEGAPSPAVPDAVPVTDAPGGPVMVEVGARLRTLYDENVLRESADGLAVFLGRPGNPNFYRQGTPRHDITSRVDIVEMPRVHLAGAGPILGERQTRLEAAYQGRLYTKNPVLDRHQVVLALDQELVPDLVRARLVYVFVPTYYHRRLPWPDPALNPDADFTFKKARCSGQQVVLGARWDVHPRHALTLDAGLDLLDFNAPFDHLDRAAPGATLGYVTRPLDMLRISLAVPVSYAVADGGGVRQGYRTPDPTAVSLGGVLRLGLLIDTWRPENLGLRATGSVAGTWFLSGTAGDREYGDRTDLSVDAGLEAWLEVLDGLSAAVGYAWYGAWADTTAGYAPFDVADYTGYRLYLDLSYTFRVE